MAISSLVGSGDVGRLGCEEAALLSVCCKTEIEEHVCTSLKTFGAGLLHHLV